MPDIRPFQAETQFPKIPDTVQSRTLYKAYFAQRFMELVHSAYVEKSKEEADDLGNKWKPLSPITHIYKPLRRGEASTYGIRNFSGTRGLLTPKEDRLWRRVFYFSMKKYGKERAAQRAWTAVMKVGAKTKKAILTNRRTDINIRTGRLIKAFSPGRVAGGRYIPPSPDQKIRFTQNSMVIVINVPYAPFVHNVRPLIPRNARPWIMEAHKHAIRMTARGH